MKYPKSLEKEQSELKLFAETRQRQELYLCGQYVHDDF